MRFRNPGPSVARMAKCLNISKVQAAELKALMEKGYVARTLNFANKVLDGSGIEYLAPSGGGNGIDYVNMGDAYSSTLLFDHEKSRFLVGSWGDLVERQPRRFAD